MANMERSQHRHRSSPWGSKTDITYNEEEKQTHPRFSQVGSSGSRGMLSTTGWVPTLAYLVNDRPTPFYPKSRATRSVRWFGGSVSRLDASNVGKLSSPTATGQWHFKWHLSIAHFHVHMEMDVLHFQDSYMFFLFRISQKNLEFPGIDKQSVPYGTLLSRPTEGE